jgi:hypothetical protein
VAGQPHSEPLADCRDRFLQRLVREWPDLAGGLVDQMVMVALGVGDLKPPGPISAIEPMQQPKPKKLIQHRAPATGHAARCPRLQTTAYESESHQWSSADVRRVRVQSALHSDRTMIVAVLIMRVVQVIADEIVDVIAVWNLLMSARGTVPMRPIVLAAIVRRSAVGRVDITDFQHVFIDVIVVRVMQMAVMEIVDVILMLDRRMAAAGTMLVGVVGMNGVFRVAHGTQHRGATGLEPAGCG